jgi:YihY family inner membrane protein
MGTQVKHLQHDATHELNEHRGIKDFITKLGKDNIGMLAAFVSWTILTSMVPIMVGVVAISSLFLRSPSAQANVIAHLHSALQGSISTAEIRTIVHGSVQHAGLLGIIGFVGVLWGGSNVGGAFSTAFQAIFEVKGRNFIKEKLLDIGMIFVFTILMIVIVAANSIAAILNRAVSSFPIHGAAPFVIGTVIGLGASWLLFWAIYMVFPNIQTRFRVGNVWKGALLAAVLFQILSYIWPIYASFSHFSRYGAVLVPLLVLSAWIYFFSLITMLGAEVVAVSAIREANARNQSVGPQTNDSVPQHQVIRENVPATKAGADGATSDTSTGLTQSRSGR